MGVAREICQHLPRAGKGPFAVHHPTVARGLAHQRLELGAAVTVGGCGGSVPGVARDGFVAPVDVLSVRWRRHLTTRVPRYG